MSGYQPFATLPGKVSVGRPGIPIVPRERVTAAARPASAPPPAHVPAPVPPPAYVAPEPPESELIEVPVEAPAPVVVDDPAEVERNRLRAQAEAEALRTRDLFTLGGAPLVRPQTRRFAGGSRPEGAASLNASGAGEGGRKPAQGYSAATEAPQDSRGRTGRRNGGVGRDGAGASAEPTRNLGHLSPLRFREGFGPIGGLPTLHGPDVHEGARPC